MKAIVGAVAALLVVLGGASAYLGLFSPIEIVEQDMGPYSFVYVEDGTTDVRRITALTEELGQRLEAANYQARDPAQVYFPSGRKILNQIGFIVRRDTVALNVLGTDTFFRAIPSQRCIVAALPYRNALSLMVGRWRALATLRAHRQQRRYADTGVMVLRDKDRLLYFQPISAV